MDDDFNTARGMGLLFEAVRELNRQIDEKGAPEAFQNPEVLGRLKDMLRIGQIIGLMAETPQQYFQQRKNAVLKDQQIDAQWIEDQIGQRTRARREKDFALADRIRDDLKARNIILEDRPDGTIWKHGDGKA
jgi:cysteinyl-tRNA synthetase